MIVIWQCSENPRHRGWRDESNPEECMRRGSCDYCLAMTAFERELSPDVYEEESPRQVEPRPGEFWVDIMPVRIDPSKTRAAFEAWANHEPS